MAYNYFFQQLLQNTENAAGNERKYNAFHHEALSLKEDSVKPIYGKKKGKRRVVVHTCSVVNALRIVLMAPYKPAHLTKFSLRYNLCVCSQGRVE